MCCDAGEYSVVLSSRVRLTSDAPNSESTATSYSSAGVAIAFAAAVSVGRKVKLPVCSVGKDHDRNPVPRCSMTRCPDCDSIKMFSAESEGDGKCSVCHGLGYAGFLEMFFEPVSGRLEECDRCRGTGRCQTCAGLGVVEECEVSLAA